MSVEGNRKNVFELQWSLAGIRRKYPFHVLRMLRLFRFELFQLQKRLIRQWEDLPLSDAIAAGIDAFAAAYETDEPRVTMRKFLAAQKARKTRS